MTEDLAYNERFNVNGTRKEEIFNRCKKCNCIVVLNKICYPCHLKEIKEEKDGSSK